MGFNAEPCSESAKEESEMGIGRIRYLRLLLMMMMMMMVMMMMMMMMMMMTMLSLLLFDSCAYNSHNIR